MGVASVIYAHACIFEAGVLGQSYVGGLESSLKDSHGVILSGDIVEAFGSAGK